MIPAIDTSGTAYPVYEGGDLTDPGMSLRDRYAMAAMQGDWATGTGFFKDSSDKSLQERARLYYRMADAMLEVRGEI